MLLARILRQWIRESSDARNLPDTNRYPQAIAREASVIGDYFCEAVARCSNERPHRLVGRQRHRRGPRIGAFFYPPHDAACEGLLVFSTLSFSIIGSLSHSLGALTSMSVGMASCGTLTLAFRFQHIGWPENLPIDHQAESR